jgi:SAM-dependent methyltransferase
LNDKPLDLAMLSGFAGLVRRNGAETLADVGCGTGATTAMFAEFGLDVVGIVLSPNMIAVARRLNPGLFFPCRIDAVTGYRGRRRRCRLRLVLNRPCAG